MVGVEVESRVIGGRQGGRHDRIGGSSTQKVAAMRADRNLGFLAVHECVTVHWRGADEVVQVKRMEKKDG